METKFLKDMGLSDDQIKSIMSENGKDVEKEKAVSKKYSEQLEEVNKKLKDFDGVDVTELQGKIKTLTGDLDTTKQTYEKQIDDMKFTSLLEGKVNALSPRSAKAVMALLDVETLKQSKNQDTDITSALEAVKKDNDYLFGETQDHSSSRRIVTGTDTNHENTDAGNKFAAANEAFRTLANK